jgi:hypothetical protein
MQIDKHKTKQEISLQKKVTLYANNGKWNWNFTNCDRKENIQCPMKKGKISKTTKNTRQGFWFITLKLQTSGELQASFTPQFFHGLLCHF